MCPRRNSKGRSGRNWKEVDRGANVQALTLDDDDDMIEGKGMDAEDEEEVSSERQLLWLTEWTPNH
jgi:hypothetical protein